MTEFTWRGIKFEPDPSSKDQWVASSSPRFYTYQVLSGNWWASCRSTHPMLLPLCQGSTPTEALDRCLQEYLAKLRQLENRLQEELGLVQANLLLISQIQEPDHG